MGTIMGMLILILTYFSVLDFTWSLATTFFIVLVFIDISIFNIKDCFQDYGLAINYDNSDLIEELKEKITELEDTINDFESRVSDLEPDDVIWDDF